MESDTQQEGQERNILSSIPILKFIGEKEIDVFTVDIKNNLRTSQPKTKSYKKELLFAKHISKCSTTDEEASSKEKSMIGT